MANGMTREIRVLRHDGAWRVWMDGSSRSVSRHESREQAISAGRRLAAGYGFELVVHGPQPVRPTTR
jgi:hypothetical protein